jgi:hypothetical protein
MTKTFKAFRFDPDLYTKFKEVVQGSNLMVTEAFEKFMKTSVEIGAVKFPEAQSRRRDVETEARVLLTWLRKRQFHYYPNRADEDDSYSVPGRLLQLLPRIEDETLRKEVEDELKKKGC